MNTYIVSIGTLFNMQYRNLKNQKDTNTDVTEYCKKKSLNGHLLYILETTFFSSKICLKY